MREQMTSDIPLNQRRCLTIKQFQIYMGIGRNTALKLVKKAKCAHKAGKRILVDREAFDKWLDNQLDTDNLL